MEFREHSAALMAAYDAGDHARALDIAQAAALAYPDEAHTTCYWRACLLSRLSRPEEALSTLARAFEEGHFWSASSLEEEDDLEALRAFPAFLALARRMDEALKDAQSKARCLTLHSPVPRPRATIINLHWKGDTVHRYRSHFDETCNNLGSTTHYIQSSQMVSSAGFCWDNPDLARQEVDREVEVLGVQDPIFCGASQGGRIAYEQAHRRGTDYLGVMPAFRSPPDDSGDFLLSGRTAFIIGDRDSFYEPIRGFADYLAAAGRPVSLIVMPGVGHWFPPDFGAYLAESLAFVRPGLA